MFAVLLDALLFDEDCHHLATTTPLRFNAANDSFLELSSRPLCTLLFVAGADITKLIQVQITWRCILVGDTWRRLVARFSLQCFSLTGMGAGPPPIDQNRGASSSLLASLAPLPLGSVIGSTRKAL